MVNGNATLAALETAHGPLPRTAEVATGGGGRHLYFRAPRGLRSGVLGRGLDLKAAGGYVIAPPSRHRSGQGYAWTVPLPGTLDELPSIPDWLVTEAITTTPPPANVAADVAQAERIERTSFPHWFPSRLLVGTRHRLLLRLAGWLRGCGYGEDATLAELRTVVASRVEQPPDDTIDDGWMRQLAHAMAQKPITRFPLRARYASVAADWKGVAGRTDRRVLRQAVLPIVARHRKLHGAQAPVPIPSLTVATMADVSDRTASRSLRRLRQVRRVLDYAGRRARVDEARRYRLRPPPPDSRTDEGLLATHALLRSALGHGAKLPDGDVYRDIFLPGGFGPAARDVFSVLSVDVGQSVATVSERAGCHLGTAYRVLPRMARHGLATNGRDGWRRVMVSRERLIEVATDLGVLGKIAAGKARRERQRLVYHSPSNQKRRGRDAAARRDLQQQVLALAEAQEWPTIGAVCGAAAWRAHVKRTPTRALWRTLRTLTQQRTSTTTTTSRATKPARAPVAARSEAPDPEWSDLDAAKGQRQ